MMSCMQCNGECICKNKDDYIYDESGFVIGTASKRNFDDVSLETVIGNNLNKILNKLEPSAISYKYAEDLIIDDLLKYINKTYDEHYMTEENSIECFDAWIALGDSTPTFRNTALKYLWRYGKKNGNNKKDLMKALHYILMCLYVDHYKND